MGINTYVVTKIGEDKAAKLKAIMGALFVYIFGNFPIATIVDSFGWNPIYEGYVMLVWSALVIAITSIIILFFGRSELFPIPAPVIAVVEDVVVEAEELVAVVEESATEVSATPTDGSEDIAK
ncbi:hypothetical protein LCGC14_0223370 [marine sediment metagenome]|uniref:Uncharacterized protein n=1 Tax=marine sediment metagenome TaxID=412755 RepID=A0A0F9UGE3_9ZZZZ|nr:hypothetical protein [bacterium]